MKEKLLGVLKYKLLGKGSKSEHEGIVIETTDGREIVLHVSGDNPFQGDTLRPYVGQHVLIVGQMATNGTALFLIDSAADIIVLGPSGKSKNNTPKP